jgi:predicted methyltransferase
MPRQTSLSKARILVRILPAVAIVLQLFVVPQAMATLRVLTVVERERDTWQRPADILKQLDVHPGNVVVDFGSGAGYFALKPAPMVGPEGRVFPVDPRRESLAFLWIRARLRSYWNVRVIHGEVDNPDLPPGAIDAVLLANTYHELAQPERILRALRASMRPGARLVVVDRAPGDSGQSREEAAGFHEISARAAVRDIKRQGFEEVSREERFIDRSPDGEAWWLVVFRKPTSSPDARNQAPGSAPTR